MICTFDLTNKMIDNLSQHYLRLKGRAWGENEENLEKESIAEADAGRKIAQDDSHFWFIFKSLLTCFFVVWRPFQTVPPQTPAPFHWLPASRVLGCPAILLLIMGPRVLLIMSSPSSGAPSQYHFSLRQ